MGAGPLRESDAEVQALVGAAADEVERTLLDTPAGERVEA